MHVSSEHRHKLEPKSFKGVFVGYATCENGYKVFYPISKKLVLSRDIVFDEEASWNWEENSNQLSLIIGRFAYGDTIAERDESVVLSPASPTSPSPRKVLSIGDSGTQSKSLTSGESTSISSLNEKYIQAFDHAPLKWRKLDEGTDSV
ncbi:hypothetical protein PS1_027963 [Malus domestica]